jgi:hypothetical protein
MIIISGASDDLIEIEGDFREEIYAIDADTIPYFLSFSDGTVLEVRYDEQGMWRIRRTVEGLARYEHKAATDPDSDYSDCVTLYNVAHGVTWTKGQHP